MHRAPHLDPIHIPSIQNIFRIWMLNHQPLAPRFHNLVHLRPNILRRLPLKFNGELNTARDLLQTPPHVPFAERRWTIEE